MQKRILIATGLYPPDIGGSATYAKWLEEKLPAIGWQFQVCSFGSVRRLPKVIRHLIYSWRLFWAARRADVIYALDGVSVGVPALVVKWLSGKPLLLRLGGDYAWEQGRQRYGVKCSLDEFITQRKSCSLSVRRLVYLQGKVARAAVKVNVQSEQMKRAVASWGVADKKIEVIPNSVSPIEITKSRDDLRTKLKYRGLVLTTACRLVPWKGVDTLIKLLPELKSKLGEVTLVVLGDGPERSKLEALAKELEVSEQVKFMGRLERQAMGEAISASDIFLLNTAYEGMSHQLLEVMGLKVPIVTTRIDGNIELITDHQDGLLVEMGNTEDFIKAITELTKNPDLKASLVTNATQKLTSFSEGAAEQNLKNWLKDL